METTFECPICNEIYNVSNRRPKALPCGHTVCLSDLISIFRLKHSIICPFDSQSTPSPPSDLPDNRAVLSLLDSTEVRCFPHDSVADSFCPVHLCALCASCGHEQSCVRKQLPKDFVEVSHLVIDAVSTVFEAVQSQVDDSAKKRVAKRYNSLLRENLSLLRMLTETNRRENCIVCEVCGEVANGCLDWSQFQGFCRGHMTQGVGGEGYMLSLTGKTDAQLCEELGEMIPQILKRVNCYALTSEHWDAILDRPKVPKKVQRLAQALVALVSYEKGGFETSPDEFLCPGCRQPQRKSLSKLSVLPCFEAFHALCSHCVAQKRGATEVVCPMDGAVYSTRIEALKTVPEGKNKGGLPPFPIQGFGDLPPFPVKSVLLGGKRGGLPPQVEGGGGELPKQYGELKGGGDGQVLEPKGPKAVGSPLPPANLASGMFTLDRFPSVLPPIDGEISQRTPNQMGWKHVAGMGQVEALVFTATEGVTLLGFALGVPVDPQQSSILLSLRLYRGDSATGSSFHELSSTQRLRGGPHLLFPVLFPSPYTLQAYQRYTVKIRFQGDPDQDFEMYKGNPYEKPEIWVGEDCTIWEFEECLSVEKNEYLNGQNNLSGPILRMIYRR